MDKLNELKECTDIVDWLLSNNFSSLNSGTKLYIVKTLGKPRPDLVSLKSCDSYQNRGFNTAWYDKCEWLTGSSLRGKLFCWPCLLFSNQSGNTSWTKTGYCDLKNLPCSIERHSKRKEHIASNCKIRLFVKQNIVTSVDSAARKYAVISYNNQVKENRFSFKKIIDATIFYASHGHYDKTRGNFKELLSLFGKYDTNLKNFLGKSNIFSEAPIENDLVDSVSFVLKGQIKKEIQEATFFAWQVDVISCGGASLLSIVFRYVKKSEIVERFMGFYDRTAVDFFNLLITECDQYDFRKKLVAQTYGGAAHLNGLPSKIKSVAPRALFTHCHAHDFNLVLSEACKGIKECRIFFAGLSGFAAFFSNSAKRIDVLNERIQTCAGNFTSKSVLTVQQNRDKLIEVFDFIIDSEGFRNDVQSIRESVALKNLLNDQTFCFMLGTFKLIFEQSEKIFQKNHTDIGLLQQQLTQLIETLKTYRDNEFFPNIYEPVASNPDEPSPEKKRKFHLDSPELKQIFVEIIDTIIGQIKFRFRDLKKLSFFGLLAFEKFELYSKNFPQNLLDNLLRQYPFFDSSQLKNELSVLYNDPQMFHNCKTPLGLLKFMFQNDLVAGMPELYKFVSIVVTIPVASVSGEPNFCALKRIKNYSRNAIDGLSNYALLSIEKQLVREMCQDEQFYENVTDHFATTKNRGIPLTFKLELTHKCLNL